MYRYLYLRYLKKKEKGSKVEIKKFKYTLFTIIFIYLYLCNYTSSFYYITLFYSI